MKIGGFFLCCFVCFAAYANDDKSSVFDDVMGDFNNLRAELVAEYPELAEQIDGKTDTEQMMLMRGFLARRAFDFYKQKYMSELYLMSDETGRAVKTKTRMTPNGFGKRVYYWLDRGELDMPKCDLDFDNRTGCNWPDEFVEYKIVYQISTKNGSESLVVEKDDIKNNRHDDIDISITVRAEDDFDSDGTGREKESARISILTHSVSYQEYHEYRNAIVTDVRAGIAHRVSNPDPDNPSAPLWEFDADPKWKSNQVPVGVLDNFFSNYSRDKSVKIED